MTSWMLNTVGLLATTIGALIDFLHLHRTQAVVAKLHQDAPLPEGCVILMKDRRLLKITIGLISAWFLVQYIAVLFT